LSFPHSSQFHSLNNKKFRIPKFSLGGWIIGPVEDIQEELEAGGLLVEDGRVEGGSLLYEAAAVRLLILLLFFLASTVGPGPFVTRQR
jgi:hypothetical protein